MLRNSVCAHVLDQLHDSSRVSVANLRVLINGKPPSLNLGNEVPAKCSPQSTACKTATLSGGPGDYVVTRWKWKETVGAASQCVIFLFNPLP